MKHTYDTDQLRQALTDASMGFMNGIYIHGGDGQNPDSWTFGEVEMLEAIIDALPEPATDEWQECSIHQVRNGEIFRARYHNGTVIEAEAKAIGPDYISFQKHQTLATVEASDFEQFYRIPAPVTTPDPAKHPVIIVDTNYGGLKGRHPFVWDGEMYAAVSGPIKHANPETITDWTPGKVVEDDR